MKRFAILTLLCCLFFANIADAKFSDEYRAKYPGRVKVTKRMDASGKNSTMTTYKLFKHRVNDVDFDITLRDFGGLIKFCTLNCGTLTGRPAGLTNYAWGDGEKAHELTWHKIAYIDRFRSGTFFNYLSVEVTKVDLEDMKKAVAFSVQGPGAPNKPILYSSHKRWKDWLEAIEAAEKIMSER